MKRIAPIAIATFVLVIAGFVRTQAQTQVPQPVPPGTVTPAPIPPPGSSPMPNPSPSGSPSP